MDSLMGIPIRTSEYFTVTVRRSWRERLFSWPWRPWIRTREEPDPNVYLVSAAVVSGFVLSSGGRVYVAAPATVARLREAIAQEKLPS